MSFRDDYIGRLQAALLILDVKAEVFSSGVKVNGVHAYVSTHDLTGQVVAVSIKTGYSRYQGHHRFTKVADVAYIAGHIRRIVEEEATKVLWRKQNTDKQEATRVREQAAAAPVTAAIDAVNAASAAALRGRQVTKLAVAELAEVNTNGTRDYRFEFQVNNLTEAQALAILAIVSGK